MDPNLFKENLSIKTIQNIHSVMGRIRGLFCSFCLDDSTEQSASDRPYGQGIDVSHLATPHIPSSNLSQEQPAQPTQNHTTTSDNREYGDNCSTTHRQNRTSSPISSEATPYQSHATEATTSNRNTPERDDHLSRPSNLQNQRTQMQNLHPEMISQHQHTPSPHPNSPTNNYEPQHCRTASPHIHQNQHNPVSYQERNMPSTSSSSHQAPPVQQQQQQQQPQRHEPQPSSSNGGATKLSYDIISVREPLAKILAEKQLLLQQQRREPLGDHEYIEVYGERGSSCFYEEIAGSVTSSATYDQIGASSNHNYQVLMNAYSAVNRQNSSDYNDRNEHHRTGTESRSETNPLNSNPSQELIYDLGLPRDSVDGPPPTSATTTTNNTSESEQTDNQLGGGQDETRLVQVAQSIPVYSVINKATRRNNPIMRAHIQDDRPPRPPPKNLQMNQQQSPSTSAIHTFNDPTNAGRISSPNPIPSTSTYNGIEIVSNTGSHHKNSRLPQPPPRLSKLQILNSTTCRPLPLPDENYETIDNVNDNNNILDMENRNLSAQNDDIESLNNGYELLRSNNIEDDLIDVGYERIRESNRYSGGSLSSQLCQIQLLDNGGYESVQPIYSSPSNALAEPNYEAIAPATASELAAAATARLTAAATVIEHITQNRLNYQNKVD